MTEDLQDQKLPLGVIIAGGKSRRMGSRNKLFMSLGDKLIIEHVIDKIRPQVDALYLNCNDRKMVSFVDVEVVPDYIEGKQNIGPIGGLYTALKLAKSIGFSQVLTTPGDTPFLPDNFVHKLSRKLQNDVAVATSHGRQHPIAAIWKTETIDIVQNAIEANTYKMHRLLDQLNVTQVIWDNDPDPFLNINSEEDYKIAVSRL